MLASSWLASIRTSHDHRGVPLVGAAAGVVFDALGEERLATYFKQNLSVSTGFPTHRGGKLVTNAAIGLGAVDLGGAMLLATLGMSQVDTSDRRIPNGLLVQAAEQESWAFPTLSVALLSRRWLPCFADGKCYPPVVVVGATAPQFYPGSPLAAIGALFTENRKAYRREGSWGINVGVAVPLRALERPKAPERPGTGR